jgi:hypothetical protein
VDFIELLNLAKIYKKPIAFFLSSRLSAILGAFLGFSSPYFTYFLITAIFTS